ncbi:MAG TPA: Ig-like domain-containing protein, partial [Gemmatimonadaceae bacterium]
MNVVGPTQDSTVTAVTVSPPTATLNVGDKILLVATVTAGPGQTNRNVVWTTGNAAVATVDANGNVTAVGGGTTSIVATSSANSNVKGAAAITVGAVVQPTVTISTINQTTAAGSVPATLSNVAGQLDVTLNVDAGTQKLSKVDLIMNCGGADTVVATQSIASGDVAPLAAEASSSPVTLSFNTGAFNATNGSVAFKNGACTLKGRATTTTGVIVASSGTAITLNNTNIVSATLTTTPGTGQVASATDANGLLWRAGSVTVTAVPVIFSANTTIATASVSLMNAGNDAALGKNGAVVAGNSAVGTLTGLAPAAGVVTASFPLSTSATGGVGGAVVDTLGVQVTTVDSNGNPGPTLNASSLNFIRLDNRAPDITTVAPTYVAGTQNTANGWVGKNFIFSVAAGSLTGGSATADNQVAITAISPNSTGGGGVDKVVLNTQWAPQGTSASSTAWATFTSVTSLAETPAATGSVAYDLRLQVCDALGNCATTPTLATFGVDLTPPTATTASGPKTNEIDGIGQALTGGGSVSVSASDPQGANLVAGSGFGSNPVLVQETQLAPSGATGQATTCVAGLGVALSPNTGCKGPTAVPLTFTAGTASPGQYALTYTVTDQAGNQSAPVTLNYYLDQTAAPQMTGGIAIPASITAGAVFTASGTDDMDFAAVNAYLNYPGVARVVVPGTSSAV